MEHEEDIRANDAWKNILNDLCYIDKFVIRVSNNLRIILGKKKLEQVKR